MIVAPRVYTGAVSPDAREPADTISITRAARMPERIAPMLATSTTEPFDSPDYIFELMWSGVRAHARISDRRVTLMGRNGIDLTPAFPELDGIGEQFRVHEAILDGEIVGLDAEGQPSFDLLRARLASLAPSYSDRDGAGGVPSFLKAKRGGGAQICFQAFDVLWLDGRSLVDRPLWQRKNRLHEQLRPRPWFAAVDFVPDEGVAFFDAVAERRLDGIVAKQKSSTYTPGRRSKSWLEVRALESGDFVVGGYTFGGARRKGEPFSQLLLGAYDGGRFDYVGAVSGGLADAEARELVASLEPLLTDVSPFADPPPIARFIYWTRPELVCRIRFSEWSRDGYLRFPIFNALRPDVDPSECVLLE